MYLNKQSSNTYDIYIYIKEKEQTNWWDYEISNNYKETLLIYYIGVILFLLLL